MSPQEDKLDVEELELFKTRFKVSTQVPRRDGVSSASSIAISIPSKRIASYFVTYIWLWW